MTKAKGYSLWLIPTGNAYNRLERLISQLSKKYNTPTFEPHLTLIGEIQESKEDVVSKTSNLASSIKPYYITLSDISYLDEYFRCLFIRANKVEELLKSNLLARRLFKRENGPEYMPHLSLMYSNLSSTTKETIISEIGKEFNLTFRVESIHLYSTEGEVKDWYKIREFSLKDKHD